MAEQQQQENQQQQQQQQQQQENQQQRDNQQQQEQQDWMVPKGRLNTEVERRKQAEQELQQMREEQEERENKIAEEQGDHKKRADTYQKKFETEREAHNALKARLARNEKLDTFRRAAGGVINAEALDDAFRFVEGDYASELEGADAEDEGTFRAFAQRIAESRPYMAAGPRGTGSFGSRHPVLGGPQRTQNNGAIKLPIGNSSKRRFK